MAKTPAFQFYPGDWMKDPALRSVSLEARGLWMDMLCLMHESTRRGYLQHSTGKPMSHEQIARMSGCSPEVCARLLEELEETGVFSRENDGTIYSRRMAREALEKDANAERQRRYYDRNNKKPNGEPNANLTVNLTPTSHTSSSSTSSSCTTNVVQREGPVLEAQTAVAAPAPQPKPKAKAESLAPASKKPSRDPALDNPATQIYRETFKRTPNEAQRAEIQRRVTDLNHYRTTLANWQLSGWNPGNVLGQLDRYEQTKPKIEDQTLTVQQPECVALAPTGTGGMANYGQPIQRHQPKTFAQLNTEENARRLNGNASIREQIRTGALQLPRIGKTG
jgi:hypothetical protein